MDMCFHKLKKTLKKGDSDITSLVKICSTNFFECITKQILNYCEIHRKQLSYGHFYSINKFLKIEFVYRVKMTIGYNHRLPKEVGHLNSLKRH